MAWHTLTGPALLAGPPIKCASPNHCVDDVAWLRNLYPRKPTMRKRFPHRLANVSRAGGASHRPAVDGIGRAHPVCLYRRLLAARASTASAAVVMVVAVAVAVAARSMPA